MRSMLMKTLMTTVVLVSSTGFAQEVTFDPSTMGARSSSGLSRAQVGGAGARTGGPVSSEAGDISFSRRDTSVGAGGAQGRSFAEKTGLTREEVRREYNRARESGELERLRMLSPN